MSFSASAVKIQHTSLRDQVESAVSTAIISGQLSPGTLVTVPTLAAEFAVSATPVREALLELAGRGLLEPVRNKGFRVTEVSQEDVHNIADVRMYLEPEAMYKLAPQFDSQHEPSLREIAEQISTGAETGDLETYLRCDVEFHSQLTAMLNNPLLTELVNDLRTRARLSNLELMAERGLLKESADEHHELLDALVAGDAETAREIMRRHIRHTAGIWAGNIEDQGDG